MRRLMAFMMCMLFLVTGCSQTTHSQNETALTKMEKAGNITGMITYYKCQLKTHPNDPMLLKVLAELYYAANDVESAVFYTKQHGKITSPDKEILFLKGKVYDDLGDYPTSLSAFEQSAILGKSSSEFYIRYGIVLSKVGNYHEAEVQFNLARLGGHDEITIKNNLAVLYLMQKKYSDAVNILLPLLPHAKQNPMLTVNLAVALIKQGDERQAYSMLKALYNDEQLRILLRLVKDMEHA